MERRARLEGRRAFTLHGEDYLILYLAFEDAPDEIVQVQFPTSDLPTPLRVGETLLVDMLFSVPTRVRRPGSPAEGAAQP